MVVLRLENITKRFGPLVANDRINLELAKGEVLALLGENGAGKTTLMNILFGHYVADEGTIEVDGKRLAPGSTNAAIDAGIGMVHQHFTLADNLTVLENITLGTEPLWAFRQRAARARAKLARMSEEFGLAVNPDADVATLSVGERQRVEILKALYRGARVLILDEPTAVLTPQETDDLFATLRRLTSQGMAIIFISHKLHEILAISDRVSVLRRGAIVGEVLTKDADRNQLAEMMVGEEVIRPKPRKMQQGEPVLTMAGINATGTLSGIKLHDVDLTINQHQIFGIAGVAGNGQSVLADLLSGLIAPESGKIHLMGEPVTTFSASDMVARGVGRIPEDRHQFGIIGEMAIWENLISENLVSPQVSKWRTLIDKPAAVERAEQLIEEFDIRCQGPHGETKLMSGGNIQKLILARALAPQPKFILANQPVRGLDEGAIAYVQGQLLAARDRGAGILLISEDLDELLALSDRIAVMYDGKLSESFANGSKTLGQIGLMMAGQQDGITHLRDQNGVEAPHAN